METDAGKSFESGGAARACPACGAEARRRAARFCATCGRELMSADYFPSDSLRASYHLQGRRAPAPGRADADARRPLPRSHPRATPLHRNSNGAATTALAFVTYSLVPYVGILFCPGALVCGVVGLLRARRAPLLGGRRAAALSVVLGFVVLGAQVLLWWVLYKIPEWTRQM